ncbi:MAG: hypothetical protein ACE5JR_12380 [Gemmatimonadota bacterium]
MSERREVVARRTSSALRAVGLAGLLACLVTGRAAGQDPSEVRVGITYTPGFRPGLVMTPVERPDGLAEMADSLEAILRRDLDYSDRFEIIPVPSDMPSGGPVNYGLWNQLGAVWLLRADLSGTESFPVLRLTLHDVVFGELKEVQAFSLPAGGSASFRLAVHSAADAAVQWATGDPGIAATRIVFRRKLGDGASDIFIVDSDGFNLRRLTNDNSIVYSPALSPDGTRLLYVSYISGEPAVYEKNLTTGRIRTISAAPGLNITPVYSPDGRRILLARSVGGRTELFDMQADPLCCASRVTVTRGGDALNPSYSPDGRRVSFTATPLGQPQVYVQNVNSTPARIISRYVFGEEGYSTSPDWSPRGDRIAYHGWIDRVFQIVTVNPDGSDRRVLTSTGSNEDPSWAPDGRHLVFASERSSGRALLILDTVSGRIRTLTRGRVDQLPDWSDALPAGP